LWIDPLIEIIPIDRPAILPHGGAGCLLRVGRIRVRE
jgi:hypothetical protein